MDVRATPVGEARIPAHVEVTVQEPPPGTATVTVTRTAQRRTFDERGYVAMSVYSDPFGRDFEVPFDIPATYTAHARSSSGVVLETASAAPVQLASIRSSSVTIHDPLRPKHTMTLLLEEHALTGGTRPLGTQTIALHGRSVPIASGALRGGWQGVAFDVVTFTDDEAEQFDRMFGGYDADQGSGVLCIRPSGDVPALLPRVFFASIAAPNPEPYYRQLGRQEILWRLEAVEVVPPAPALVEPLVTWADWQAWIDGNFGLEGLNRTFPTWAAVNRSLLPLGWADRPAERYASWADLEAWLDDHGGWAGFNAAFPTWADFSQAEEPIGWASR